MDRIINVGVIVRLLFGKSIEAFGAIVAAGARAALGEPDRLVYWLVHMSITSGVDTV